jgi:membrane fusion protein, heavy metal efflux system
MAQSRLAFLFAALQLLAALSVHAQAAAQFVQISAPSQARRQLVLSPVMRKAITGRISATAMVEANAGAVAQVTSEIPARVVKLVAQLGQRVSRGEPLVIMSSVELGEAKTGYLKARSLESITSQHLRREQELYARRLAR